jgi:hypothetical protein
MHSRKSLRRARRSNRPTLAARSSLIGTAVGLVVLTGFASTNAAFAAPALTAPLPAVASALGSAGETLEEISTDAESTLRSARAAVAEAAAIESEVAASGLDLGADTSIDTRDLSGEIERLSTLDVLPALLLPAVTDDTAAETRRVSAEIVDLRDRLEAAQAQKAAEEAAAAAQRAAEEAAAQAAAKAQAEAEAAAAALAAANTPEGAQATARRLASANYGWGEDQFSCLSSLWHKESGWNYQAYNDSSGATGIPQALPGSKMASAGSDWQTNATTQIIWGLDYISAVYGTPCSAWGHSQATNWY